MCGRDGVGDHVDGNFPGGLDLDVGLAGGSSSPGLMTTLQCRVCLTGFLAK